MHSSNVSFHMNLIYIAMNGLEDIYCPKCILESPALSYLHKITYGELQAKVNTH